MDRFVCIHGHFYQPPRENPWLESIEYQDSAYPYHDWNERITAESYAPNEAARILDGQGKIIDIVNNYASISFNFGPTLLSWTEAHAPDVYEAILEADKESMRRFSGHGSALAQAYNHMILPLANERDKCTQVLWGLRDFVHRFRRKAEGMWLPETAVDLDTLEMLAEAGIKFTILSPYQALRTRPIAGEEWREVPESGIDPTMPYRLKLPSGRTIDIFFYDGPISRAVAFEGLLSSGERFADRLMGGFSDSRSWPQLVHIATDGESYGHHHRWGEMALAYALHHIRTNKLARITVYGEFLDLHPPTHEVQIKENTAWSCSHGVERWRSDCGCNSGGRPWNQAWRAPLRIALDELRDAVGPLYEAKAHEYLIDPWAARDDYISVVLDRSPQNVRRFLSRHAQRKLNADDETTVLQLMELQRNAMLMYTSCGWFFDDISGIETVQVLQYAGRVVQLARDLFDEDLETPFVRRLAEAKSNVPEHGDGAKIYEKWVKPSVVRLIDAGAHYAISSLFEDYESSAVLYHYRFDLEDYRRHEHGNVKLAVGRARVSSEVTEASETISFGVLHFGDQNISAGVRQFVGHETYEAMATDVIDTFQRADLAEVIRALDRHFGKATYSFRSLFKDEQRKILEPIMQEAIDETESSSIQVYEHHGSLFVFMGDPAVPFPRPLKALAELVLNVELRRQLQNGIDNERIASLLAEVKRASVPLHEDRLGRFASQAVERRAEAFKADPKNQEALERLIQAVEAAQLFPFRIDLWRVQNTYWQILHDLNPKAERPPRRKTASERKWEELYTTLGDKLGVRIPG